VRRVVVAHGTLTPYLLPSYAAPYVKEEKRSCRRPCWQSLAVAETVPNPQKRRILGIVGVNLNYYSTESLAATWSANLRSLPNCCRAMEGGAPPTHDLLAFALVSDTEMTCSAPCGRPAALCVIFNVSGGQADQENVGGPRLDKHSSQVASRPCRPHPPCSRMIKPHLLMTSWKGTHATSR
jgi:hypothetical protein